MIFIQALGIDPVLVKTAKMTEIPRISSDSMKQISARKILFWFIITINTIEVFHTHRPISVNFLRKVMQFMVVENLKNIYGYD